MPQRVQSLRSSTKLSRPAGREPGELYVNWADKQFGVVDSAKNPMDLLAIRFFSTATDYVAGDFVINAGTGYKAKGNIPAGAFNASQWDTLVTGTGAEPPIPLGTTSQYWRGDKTWQLLNQAAVGLGNVDNTSDLNKPISTATQSALNLKAPLASPVLTGTPQAPTPAPGTSNTQIATTAFVSAAFAVDTTSWDELTGKPATFPPTLPIPSSGVTGLDTAQAAQDAAIATKISEAPTDGLTYGRKNAQWATMVGGAVISDTPPAEPLQPGQLWWESDTGNTYIWFDDGDSKAWIQQNVQPAPPVGGVPVGTIRTTVLSTPGAGNYVKPVGLKYLRVTLVGGGGGGSRAGTTAASQMSAGGAGGGGATCIKLYAAADLAATEAYVVGAGGTASTGVGNNGTPSTFKSLSAGGGIGGGALMTATAVFTTSARGAGGTAGGGDLNITGGRGMQSFVCNPAYPAGRVGMGGSSFFASGAAEFYLTTGGSAGSDGDFPGGGGTGTVNGASTAATVGTAGGGGMLMLEEYF